MTNDQTPRSERRLRARRARRRGARGVRGPPARVRELPRGARVVRRHRRTRSPTRTRGPAPPRALRDRIVQAAARGGPPKVVALRPRRTRLYAGDRARGGRRAPRSRSGCRSASPAGAASDKLGLTRLGPTSGVAQLDRRPGFGPAPAGKVYEVWVIDGRRSRRRAGAVPRRRHAVVDARAAGAEGRDRRGHARAGAAAHDADTPPIVARRPSRSSRRGRRARARPGRGRASRSGSRA